MAEAHWYRLYGLTVRMPFHCPNLTSAPSARTPDVDVVEGPVPRRLPSPAATDPEWDAEVGRFLFRGGRRSARFLVEGGDRITLDRNRDVEEDVLTYHLLHVVLAALLRQRGLVVLHANSAGSSGGAIVVAGESGAGKSTTLAALVRRGCSLLADDVTALRASPGRGVEALPGVGQLSLDRLGAGALGHDLDEAAARPWQRMKALVPVPAVASDPAGVGGVFVLRTRSGDDVELTELEGSEKFAALVDCVYGPLLPAEHGSLFSLLSELAESVRVARVARPAGRWSVEEVVDAMLPATAGRR